jgi:hypothetical protein
LESDIYFLVTAIQFSQSDKFYRSYCNNPAIYNCKKSDDVLFCGW